MRVRGQLTSAEMGEKLPKCGNTTQAHSVSASSVYRKGLALGGRSSHRAILERVGGVDGYRKSPLICHSRK